MSTNTLVVNSVSNLLNSNGFPVDLDFPAYKTVKTWQVDLDPSVYPPEPGEPDYYEDYEYSPLEVKTPALEFNTESLGQVKQVCDLLKSTYVISNNHHSGLHVHTGRFAAPIPFHITFLKRLIIFLYVFDPQISSLHTQYRVDQNVMSGSIRDQSVAAVEFQRKNGHRPLPPQMIPLFLDAPDIETLIKLASNTNGTRYTNYNLSGLEWAIKTDRAGAIDGRGNTIEFRQHAGTLDGDAICMWVRVFAGIIEFVENISPESFVDMIKTMVEAETWEKEYDGEDDEREAKYGPIPADGPFTIIDLLQHIGLKEEAEF